VEVLVVGSGGVGSAIASGHGMDAVRGASVQELQLPEGARLISVMRDGVAEIAVGSTRLQAGDQVLAILEPGLEPQLPEVLLRP
jgi:Trk K+ transport system NAD-binding subunit